ncbi:uncharacterized protein EAF01_007197 [Botrytis porri]|uniref:PHD-type domain-containing protein n=1 Tax=Botrytis porri TaxID=87229 RepID=A0A4Z1KLP0_9HELO|nr:uncharacterized protein EAF01_007197 [Botrytis porri]KAF7901899.1 hypothetical protein EAF01_007197 [Botrytis porri]TGO86498.1 hypothetical protein BPOR_0298g00010 [Botrytis porri]
MSWEQQASYEGSQGGWTPQFAEDYSMFNATPGRLVNGQRPFVDTSTAQALSSLAHNGHYNVEGDMMTDMGMHMHQLSPNSGFAIAHTTSPNKHVSAATAPQPASRARFSDVSKTPQKSKKKLDDPFSGQTATPPHSIGKGTRKLAPKIFNVSNNAPVQGNGFESSDSNNHHPQLMAQSSTAMDPFGYPMTVPASTPFFASNKAIWDTSMDSMDLDFSTDSAGIFQQGHRASNSIDWGRSNQMFQESVNVSPRKSSDSKAEVKPRKRHRQIASKTSLPITSALPTSLPLLAFSSATATSNSIAMENFPGVVDPGIIYSRPSTGSTSQGGLEDMILPASRPTTSPIRNLEQIEPYQHQVREYTREQEELRRSRSFRESSMGYRIDRRTASSPVKGSARSGPRRSVSESNRDQRRSEPPRFNSGRLSPVKQQRHPNLTSIPESPAALPKLRRDVKLAIGSNGRATVVVDDESVRSLRRSSSQVIGYESEYDSSTDDEPIIIPSRNNSFNLPQQRPPRFDLFDTSSSDFRRPSTSTSGYSRSSGQHTSIDEMSEAETVLDEAKIGDAASALRKVVRERRSNQQLSKNGRHLRLYSDTTPRPGRFAEYTSSSNNSPDGTTPSSSRSGTTRCICNNAEGDSFMIQCESCENWLHGQCVNIPDRRTLPKVYICAFCALTPNMRNGRVRESAREKRGLPSSPLAHKSFKSFR